MKNIIQFLLIGLAALTIASCDRNETEQSEQRQRSNIQNLLHKEARHLILTSVNDRQFVILDVRTPEEYDRGHLKNAFLINFYNPGFASEIDKLERDSTYLVYCHSGGRSLKTAQMMQKMGFKNIHNLKHGVRRGFPMKPQTPGVMMAADPTELKVNLMGH